TTMNNHLYLLVALPIVSSIQHLITTVNKESAIIYLNKFSLLMRNHLESCIESKVVLSEEISLLKKYLALEALRFNNSFKYNISINENLDAEAIDRKSVV